ncbi:MAG TPA: hypothetical protein VFQ45_00045 [Longimicrobium sp.]|nr:hypothetical protein [Longimicrobium sp.]
MSTGVLDGLPRRGAARPSPLEAPQAERTARRQRRRRALGRAAVVVAVAGSLALVVARQTVAVERQRALAALQEKISIAEAERVEWSNRIQELQTRARITRVASERLGLHVARDDEVVLLPVPAAALEGGR